MIELKKSLAIVALVIVALVSAAFLYCRATGRELPFGLGGGGGGGGSSQGFFGKLSDALKIGTAMKCEVSEGDVNASFYLKGGKLRGEVVSPTDGEKVEYIIRDNCMYYWSEKEDQGLKWCWDPSDVADWEENLAAATENYNCKPQTISDSMFSLPSGIEFMDMSSYMQQFAPSE